MDKENKNKIICSECRSDKVRKIVHGLIEFNSKEDEESFKKENYYSGCEMPADEPKFHCDNCNKNFGNALINGRLPLDKIKKII